MSTLLGIILEALIAVAHSHAIDDVQQSAGWVERPNSPFSHPDPDNGYVYVLINLQRRKDENVFFILFHVFQFYLGMDSVSGIVVYYPISKSVLVMLMTTSLLGNLDSATTCDPAFSTHRQ